MDSNLTKSAPLAFAVFSVLSACANNAPNDTNETASAPRATQSPDAKEPLEVALERAAGVDDSVDKNASVSAPGDEIANLPYARGKTFKTLDDYLAHLEMNGAIDLPYWKKIGPDLYEWVVRMPGAERQTATRAELMARYGFAR